MVTGVQICGASIVCLNAATVVGWRWLLVRKNRCGTSFKCNDIVGWRWSLVSGGRTDEGMAVLSESSKVREHIWYTGTVEGCDELVRGL